MTEHYLSGYQAIEYAVERGLKLNKYADPTDEAQTGLSLEEASEVAAEDPSLIWVAATLADRRDDEE